MLNLPDKYIYKSYFTINLVLVTLVGILIAYAAAFDPQRSDYPIRSAYQVMTGENSISTGLSRSYSSIVRMRFSDARSYNPHGLRTFLFFLVQFIFRLSLLFLILRGTLKAGRLLIIADVSQSLILFAVCFWPFLVFWTEII